MLSRNSSGALTSKSNFENISASITQKDKIISMLQKQLDGFRLLRQNYERLKDRKIHLLEKCESFSRQITINRDNQGVRQDSIQKQIIDSKIMVNTLQNQLQNKNYYLKDLKSQSQILIKTTEQKQNDLFEYNDAIDNVKSNIQTIKLETERTFNQIVQTKDQIQKLKQHHYQTNTAIEKIKNQVHNTQTFIRKLIFEQSKLTETLSNLEDQNNSIDQLIQDLNSVYQSTKNKARDAKQQKQQIILNMKTKQLQKGRIKAQFSSKSKQLKVEKQKQKAFKQLCETRKQQIQRLNAILKQVKEQGDQLTKENMEAESINNQLRVDLITCKKHMQNVTKNNSSIKENLQSFMKTNANAIKKLKRPLDQVWPEVGYKRQLEDMETGEGFLQKTV